MTTTTTTTTYTVREPGCAAWATDLPSLAHAARELRRAHDRGLDRARIYDADLDDCTEAATSSTMAELVAELFGGDGLAWRLADGTGLAEVCDALDATWTERDGDTSRVQFRDGSALVLCRSGWDLGHADCDGCHCWPDAHGGGHDELCEHAGNELASA